MRLAQSYIQLFAQSFVGLPTWAGQVVGDSAPAFDGIVADMVLPVDVLMTPYDFSTHFQTEGAVDTYSATPIPAGLNLDPVTGILSGTPTVVSIFNPIVTGTNEAGSADSNVFNIDVIA